MVDFTVCRETKSGNIITPKARMSFPNLFTAKAFDENSKPKFNLSLLIPPTADISLLKKAAAAAAFDEWGDKMPGKLKSPFLKAEDVESSAEFPGWILVRASAISKPGIVDGAAKNVVDESEVYAGRWCVASLRAFVYDMKGNKGVAFGLQNVQLLDHDTPLGGRARAEDEFAPVEGAKAGKSAGVFD